MPEKCSVTSVVKMDGKLYVTAITANDFASFTYDINKEQWAYLPKLPIYYFVLVAVQSKKQLLAIGGTHFKGTMIYGTMSNKVMLLDEKYQKWDIQYPNMPTARCSITGICYHSTVVVAGGITDWGDLENWSLTRKVEVLHINDSSLVDSHWTMVEQLPHVIYGAIPVLCNDQLYISSAVDYIHPEDNNTFTVLTASVPKLLKSSNTSSDNSLWSKLPDIPYSSSSLVCYQGHLITFNGYRLVEQPNPVRKLLPIIYMYNPETVSWDCVGYVSCGYLLGRAVCIENKILFVGGLTNPYNKYNNNDVIHKNLQLELKTVVHKLHPSIITY